MPFDCGEKKNMIVRQRNFLFEFWTVQLVLCEWRRYKWENMRPTKMCVWFENKCVWIHTVDPMLHCQSVKACYHHYSRSEHQYWRCVLRAFMRLIPVCRVCIWIIFYILDFCFHFCRFISDFQQLAIWSREETRILFVDLLNEVC